MKMQINSLCKKLLNGKGGEARGASRKFQLVAPEFLSVTPESHPNAIFHEFVIVILYM
jgi:hypothetical protein